jgi:catechol 2,3-dioxygenase-like lactoylglutathione lyase family enzyme
MNVGSALKLGAIAQISRTVSDTAAAERWYGPVLGLPHLYTFGKLAFFDCGGTRLYLSAEQPPGPESILYRASTTSTPPTTAARAASSSWAPRT